MRITAVDPFIVHVPLRGEIADSVSRLRVWGYPGLTITVEEGKLTAVDRNAQATVPVKVHSDPDGADVFLDGNFVSSTPVILRLQPGTYMISVKMSGYTNWEREVKILSGAEVNLNAKLSK